MKIVNISDIIDKEKRDNIIKNTFVDNLLDISIKYSSDFTNAKVLRDFIIDVSDFFCFSWTWKSRLTLIVDELNNNAVEYWSLKNDINILRLKIIREEDLYDLSLEVEDSWKWEKHKTAKEMILLRNKKKLKWFFKNEWIRWRWLFMIIEKLVDELYFKDSENWWLIVWIKKKINLGI